MKNVVFTFKLESELRDEFAATVDRAKRSASDVVRELMRDYIKKQQDEILYRQFVRDKVDAARASSTNGEVLPDEMVAVLFRSLRDGDEDDPDDPDDHDNDDNRQDPYKQTKKWTY